MSTTQQQVTPRQQPSAPAKQAAVRRERELAEELRKEGFWVYQN